MMNYDSGHNGLNTIIGFVCGILGGLVDYAIRASQLTIFAVMQAGITALVCGGAGVAGKELYLYLKNKITKKNKIKSHG